MTPSYITLTEAELDSLILRLETKSLLESDHSLLLELVKAVLWLDKKLMEDSIKIAKLRKIFGIMQSTERLTKEKGEVAASKEETEEAATTEEAIALKKMTEEAKQLINKSKKDSQKTAKKPKKRSAKDLLAADVIDYPHLELKIGGACPCCESGKLYYYGKGSFIKVTGNPPLTLQIHQPEKLRCSTCQEIFTAPLPPELNKKCFGDSSACAIASIMRYALGTPFERSSQIQKSMGHALSPSQHWELCKAMSVAIHPIYQSLYRHAATGYCLHNDDTKVKILSLIKENKERKGKKKKNKLAPEERQGMHTTAILSTVGTHRISIFIHGRKHSGENMNALLKERPPDLPPPLQMCDALSHNMKHAEPTELCHCLVHARRNFYDVVDYYPAFAKEVLQGMASIFVLEKQIIDGKVSPAERLALHKAQSLPILEKIKFDCEQGLEDKLYEPNSNLGKACAYFLKYWKTLTKFTQIENAPIHNNDAERMIKTQVLQRKNSLFYKTQEGARVGSILSSVIQTAKSENIPLLNYLRDVMDHEEEVSKNPENWLPWNYMQHLKNLAKGN